MADGGRRGFAAGGEVVLAPMEYDWGIVWVEGTRFRSGTRLFLAFLNRNGTRLFEIWGKLQTFPPSKISDILWVGGRTVISGVPNGGRDRFRPSAWVFWRP